MKLAVDLRSSLYLLAMILWWLGLALLAPLIVALIYGETLGPWLASLGITVGLGSLLRLVGRAGSEIAAREAFFVVSVSWLILSAIGALPFLWTGALGPVDAFFESMSGFTTTGATVFTEVESKPRSLLFWRALTQWLGGMGILVIAIAILPKLAVGGRQLMVSEVPGMEIERLTPRIRQTAQALWTIYAGLSLAEILVLLLLGVSLYEAVTHTFTTIATGGYSTRNTSFESFSSHVQWAVTVFMLLGGTNFALFYRAFHRKPSLAAPLLRDEEFRIYLLIFLAATALVSIYLFRLHPTLEEALRHSAFQVASIMTTTGYASTDSSAWNSPAQWILLALMFVGGSAGSTAGSIKIVRTLLLFKLMIREVRRILHPHAVLPIRLGARVLSEEALRGVMLFAILYVVIFAVGCLVLIFEVERAGVHLPWWDAISAVAASLSNVGPGFGVVGAMGSYASLPEPSKIFLALLMWVGRLEIFPIVVLLTKSYWRG
jgi:trk system potassium uptake protein TrkH